MSKSRKLFCTITLAVCLCSAFYAYGQTDKITTLPNPADNTNAGKVDLTHAKSEQHVAYRIGVNVTEMPDILLSHFDDNAAKSSNDSSDNTNVDNAKSNKADVGQRRGLVIVASVMPDSSAAAAGLKRGDVIVKFADKEINSPETLVNAVNESGGTEQNIVLIRKGKKIELKITPQKITTEELTLQNSASQRPNTIPFPPRHFKLGNRQELLREIEKMFGQLKDGSGVDMFFSLPNENEFDDDNNNNLLELPKLNLQNPKTKQLNKNESKSISIMTQSDSSGKSKIKVKKSETINNETKESTWEAESIDTLPDEIRDEVKQMLKTK